MTPCLVLWNEFLPSRSTSWHPCSSLQVFTRRPGHQQLGWLVLAILSHALMGASAVFIAGQWGGYAAEAILGILAVLDIVIIFALRQPEPEPTISPLLPPSDLSPFSPLLRLKKPQKIWRIPAINKLKLIYNQPSYTIIVNNDFTMIRTENLSKQVYQRPWLSII